MYNVPTRSTSESKMVIAGIGCVASQVLDMAKQMITMSLVIIVVLKVIFGIYIIPSSSMEPTLKHPSVALGYSLPYFFGNPMPERGDIVVFTDPENAQRQLVKRVIGIPGDSISFSGGDVYLNGERLEELYVKEPHSTYCIESFEVPEGHVFVMGDNRLNSKDSRFLQERYISVDSIKSEVILPSSRR